jgi:O-antigen/teichoic acid export membrane protein
VRVAEAVTIARTVNRRRAAFDIAVQVVGQAGNVVLGAVVAVLLVRGLGDDRYGEWSTIFAIIGIVTYLQSLGMREVTLRQIAADPEHEAEWFGALVKVRLFLCAPTLLLSVIIEVLNAQNHAMLVAGLLLTATIPIGVPTVLITAYSLRVRNRVPVAIDIAKSIAWTGAVAIIYAAHSGLVTYMLAFLAVTAGASVISVVLALRISRPNLRVGADYWKRLVRIALPVSIGGMLVLSYGKIDNVIVFQLAGARDAGLYGAVYRLLDSAQFLPAAVLTTMFPILSATTDSARLSRLVQLAFDHLAMVSLPILGFALAASSPLVDLLFGKSFAPAAGALPVLMGAFVSICFGYLAGNLTIVLGLQKRFVWLAFAALVFNVTLNLIFVGRYGFIAAAWVTLGTEVLVCSTTFAICLRKLHMRLALGRVARTVVAATVTTVLVAVLAHAGLGLLVLVPVSAVYVPLLMLLGALPPEELRALVRR